VKLQSAFGGVAGAHDFALVGDIYKKICDRTGGSSKNWVAGADYAYAFEQVHSVIHLEAEIGDGVGVDSFEGIDVVRCDVGRKLSGGLIAPASRNFFRVERRELALDFVDIAEVESETLVGPAVSEGCLCLTWVVVAVVIKKDDLSADFGLEFSRSGEFSVEKAPRKEAAGLLPEADDR